MRCKHFWLMKIMTRNSGHSFEHWTLNIFIGIWHMQIVLLTVFVMFFHSRLLRFIRSEFPKVFDLSLIWLSMRLYLLSTQSLMEFLQLKIGMNMNVSLSNWKRKENEISPKLSSKIRAWELRRMKCYPNRNIV